MAAALVLAGTGAPVLAAARIAGAAWALAIPLAYIAGLLGLTAFLWIRLSRAGHRTPVRSGTAATKDRTALQAQTKDRRDIQLTLMAWELDRRDDLRETATIRVLGHETGRSYAQQSALTREGRFYSLDFSQK